MRLADAWTRVWFRDGSPYDLAAARIVFAAHALWILLSRDLPAISGLPPAFWAGVPRSTQWRYVLFHGQAGLEHAIQWLTITALVAALVGLAPRVSCLAAGILLYHLAPLETIIWRDSAMERGFEISILALILLSCSPCADVWAIRRTANDPASERPRWQYHWPLMLMQLLVAQVYVFAGYAKLRFSGLAWVEPGNLRGWFLLLTQRDVMAVFTAPGRFLAEHPALCGAMAMATLLLEFTFPLVLVVRRSRVVLVPLAAAFHVGVLVTMNIAFLNAPQLLVFVNWAWLRRRMGATRSGTVATGPDGRE